MKLLLGTFNCFTGPKHGTKPVPGLMKTALIKQRSGITLIDAFTDDPTTWTNPSSMILLSTSAHDARQEILRQLVELSESLKANRALTERLARAMTAYCSECIGKAEIEAKSQAMGEVVFKSSVDRMAYALNCACGKPGEFFLTYYPKPVSR